MDRQYEYREFESLVAAVEVILEKEWQNAEEFEKQGKLEKEKKAIMGFSEEIEFYKKNNIKYKEVKVIDMQNVNWLKKGWAFLNAKFAKKKYGKSF